MFTFGDFPSLDQKATAEYVASARHPWNFGYTVTGDSHALTE